jgi:hypothetical protein
MKTGSGLFRRLAPRLEPGFLTIEHMTIQRMEHVGIVVDDLAAATEFFVELGLELLGEGSVEGRWVDRIVGSTASGWSMRWCKLRTATDDSSW